MQTVGLSWFLIYLQIILLFQRRTMEILAADYDQPVGSDDGDAVQPRILFGLLIVIYMLVGFSAMTLLILYRQWTLYARELVARGRR